MGHDHAHAGHMHGPSAGDFSRAFAIGTVLNLGFVVVEAAYGLAAGSMALVADAGHNLGDVLGLTLSWTAALLANRKPTKRRTYGLRSGTILAAFANALVLLFVTGGIAWESIRRLFAPQPVLEKTMIAVALIGVVVNASSAALFAAGKKDLNVRSAFLHLAADAALSLGVALAGGVMLLTGWLWVDPLVSMALSVAILASTWSLLRHSLDLVLDAVPQGIDPDAVRAYLAGLPGVLEIHDLHIWGMSTTETVLTAHLVMPGDCCHPSFLSDVSRELHERFHIHHSTLQVELPEAPDPCRLASDETV